MKEEIAKILYRYLAQTPDDSWDEAGKTERNRLLFVAEQIERYVREEQAVENAFPDHLSRIEY